MKRWLYGSLVSLVLISITAYAGPIESECQRPENNVKTKIINGLRFDLFGRKAGILMDSQKCNWDDGNFLKVTVVKTDELLHAQPLRSSSVRFLNKSKSNKLSDDFVVMREHTGGASCCFIIHAFQTKPKFKKILTHNNDFFDMTEVIQGEHILELHKEPFFLIGPFSHAGLKYNATIYNLKKNDWE